MHKQIGRKVVNFLTSGLQAHCDSDDSSLSLVDLADAELNLKDRIKTPMSYEAVKGQFLGSAGVNAFDGFRVMVAKQVNLNTVSQHTFMLGSSQTQNQPYYNYSLMLPLDEKQEKSLRFRSDLDLNLEAEVNFPLMDKVLMKTSLQLSDNGNALVVNVDHSDDHSCTQLECNISSTNTIGFNFMQAITPGLSLGGSNTFILSNQVLKSTIAGLYENDGNVIGGLYELDSNNAQITYKREVNPNRVNLLTDVSYEGKSGSSKMNVSAQYILKQSKVTIGVDSELVMRSTVESNIAQGVQLTLSAEIPQLKQDQSRFGVGILMG